MIFFLIAKKFDVLRLTPTEEILGGDIHYFGPLELTGKTHQFDIEEGLAMAGQQDLNVLNKNVNASPHRRKEGQQIEMAEKTAN